MNINDVADQVKWVIANPSPGSTQIEINGWAFSGSSPEKPIMLMHHANGMCAACWAPVAAKLADRFSIYAIDARGHGDSQHLTVPEDYSWDYFVSDLSGVAQQLIETSDHAQIAVGLGSSFGGIVTAAAEARSPGLFNQVIMLDPPIHSTPELVAKLDIDIEVRNTDDRAELVARTLRRRAHFASREDARENWRDKPLFAPWQDAGFDLYLNEGMRDLSDGSVVLKCDPTVEAHIFETTGSLDVAEFGPKVQAPVHLVHAGKGFFPEAFFARLVTLFPQGRFYQLQGGHMLPLEIPDEVVEFIGSVI
ncbi:MAG: alpha/beta hydrolase [Pseudomonadota bacterium]